MVMGDMKEMSSRYLRGCTIYGYGTSLFLGVGIPIPLLNERIAEKAAIPEEQLITEIVDYGTPRRERPVVKKVSYAELRSGAVEIGGKEVPVSPLSSFKLAREIAGRLKEWISKGQFYLSPPVERLPNDTRFNPMKQAERPQLIHEIMTKDVVVAGLEDSITKAAKIFAERGFDHLPVADKEGKLVGIITSWDVAVAVGTGKRRISEIMSRKVVTAREDEPVEAAARRLEQHEISGLPVTDKEGFIKGIITTEDISKLVGRRK
jgi:CBS domain-containing protein